MSGSAQRAPVRPSIAGSAGPDEGAGLGVVAGADVAAAAPVPVLAAVWCCSVGVMWTVELHERGHGMALGTIVDWISSGLPISEPEPTAALAHELLAQRGFQLSPDTSAGPTCPAPARHRLRAPRWRPDRRGHPWCTALPGAPLSADHRLPDLPPGAGVGGEM